MTEFFIGVLSGPVLNFLVTAWIVKQGADRTIAALDARQGARDARREARAGSTSKRVSRNVTQPRFSMAPKAKSGMASRSSFSAG